MQDNNSKNIETQMQVEIDVSCERCGSGMKGCIEDVHSLYSQRTIRINVVPCQKCIEDEIDEMKSARDDR